MGLVVSAATTPVLGDPGSSVPAGRRVIPEMPGALAQYPLGRGDDVGEWGSANSLLDLLRSKMLRNRH